MTTTTKGGPRTAEGKAIAATNATKHGVLSAAVPPAEATAYAEHLAGMREALAPVGYLEDRLTERIALTLWRMRRLDLWEAATLAQVRDAAKRELERASDRDRAAPLDSSAALLDAGELRIELAKLALERYATESPAKMREAAAELLAWGGELYAMYKVPEAEAAKVIAKLGEDARCELGFGLIDKLRAKQVDDPAILAAIGGAADADPCDLAPWTAKGIANVWRLLAEANQRDYDWADQPDTVAWDLGLKAVTKGERLAVLADRAEALIAQETGRALLPSEADQAKIQRYDAHLERALYKALHELEAMQERRRGGVSPLARVEVHGVDGARG